jgi:hypothetical protein
MKKFYFLSMLLLAGFTSFSQITATSYRGAFAPAPAAMWTNSWTNFDPQNAVYPTPNVDVTANITANTTWTAGNTYYLKGQIYVKNNATLTIEPGVVIRADHTATGAGLFVTKGAKVMAIGTATSPIVFTSDNAVGARNKGDWGGVILLGKGAYNINNGVNNIEGIAASADTEFGGGLTPDDNDNSGTLKYVRIEYGGYVYAANQEINGLTFGAVGRGTTIDYVQVSNANDDSFEWFGGAVNCKHLVAFRGLDDDFDTDNGYSGSVQFCLAVRDPNIADNPLAGSTSEGFESDNNATGDGSTPFTSAIFSNCTMIGPAYRTTLANGGTMPAGAYKRAARLRKNTKLKIFNSVFMDYLEGLHIDNSGTAVNGAAELNALNNELKFKNNIMAGITTTAKIVQVSTTGTHATGFDIAAWFNASNNTGLTTPITNAGILTLPYNTADGSNYTGLDYRPATSSIALTGADFTDASFTGILQTTYYVDVDGDGYDSGTEVLAVATPPTGYSFTTNGPDCDDTNAAIQSNCPTITKVTYRGAFAPAPIPMWTDSWTNYDPQNAVYPTPNVNVTANITTNTTWTAGNTYYLKGQIYVKNNATLTIEPGVVIRADHTATGAGLFVTKGAKVMAIGTATSPIVFTSDNAVGARNKGDWGGVILLGKGAYNINNGVNNIEGIAASADTEFGGGLTPDDNDNSGTLKYVRIEYGGYVYAANQEINGLTFGAVGRGTTIDYVQVSNANDDSFEWFGGAVNCKHLVAFRGLDDDFDTDNGYSGSVQFCLAVRDPNIADNPLAGSTSEGFESDNNATGDGSTPFTSAIFSNCTMIGPAYRTTLANGGTMPAGAYKRAARLRKNTKLKIFNSVFMDYLEGLHIDNSGTAVNGAAELNALNNELKFKNNIMAGITTTAKIVQVSTTGTHATGFDIAAWFNASNNTGLTTPITNAGILTLPYNTADGSNYTGLDYRPATSSIALTGADFTDSSLGTENFNAAISEFYLSVYPNPYTNSFKLNYISNSDETVKVAIYDLTGKLLESRTVQYEDINSQEMGSHYTSGVYIVVLKQADISKSVRIIKN